MNDTIIVTVYVLIDDLMKHLEHRDHGLAQVGDSEVLTVAVVAAKYFHNTHERAVWGMVEMGYLSGRLSSSRFNRRLHQLADWRARARRCRKLRGRAYCGSCAAKKEKFFGYRLHLICPPDSLPVSFPALPGAFHDLTPIHELVSVLPLGASVFTDGGYNSADDEATILAETQVRVIPIRRRNMQPNSWDEEMDLRRSRKSLETVNSQLEKMGVQHLHARSRPGFDIKVHASLLALACTNLYKQSR